jgi:decaprenyl-phosphate phosphoribosyltransferase
MKESIAISTPKLVSSSPVSVLFRLLRVKQWSKNLLVFAAFIFSYGTSHLDALILSASAFLAMSLVSSATYIVNDWRDVEKDRAHPKKRNRPIASGAVAVPTALAIAALCLVGGLGLAVWLGKDVIPVADVYSISTGFVLRASL